MKKHLRSDGNGGLWISKPFAIITILITVLMLFTSFVYGYAQLNLKVDNIDKNTEDIEVLKLNSQSSVDKIEEIQDDVTEMKGDIKTLLLRD